MKPTVGRIVHFYTRDEKRHANGQGNGPYPAIVIQSGFSTTPGYETMCNLKVMGFAGDWTEGSVRELEQAQASSPPESRWWVWPPRD